MNQHNPPEDIRRQYRVNSRGIILDPGKFEGEMIYVPYFWEIFLDGGADRDDGRIIGFDITREDRALFSEIPHRQRTVNIYEDEQGFVRELRQNPDEEEEEEFEQPDLDENYVISENYGGYSVSLYRKYLGNFATMHKALAFIRLKMRKDNFFPDIYFVNDHGNVELIDIKGKVIRGWV